MRDWFHAFAATTSRVAGRPVAFLSAIVVVLAWACVGPLFGFSDTWQLVINTGTTIITFLMVFLIQHTQNRDAEAVHLKLDELIKAVKGARNTLLDLEHMSDEDIATLQSEFKRLSVRQDTKRPDRGASSGGGRSRPPRT